MQEGRSHQKYTISSVEGMKQVAGLTLGQQLAVLVEKPIVTLLSGDLGVGKTLFVQGMAEKLQVTSKVKSPSFTYIHEHSFTHNEVPGKLIHIDLWRIASENLHHLDLAQYLQPGVIVAIEWWERFESEIIKLLKSSNALVAKVSITSLSEGSRELQISVL